MKDEGGRMEKTRNTQKHKIHYSLFTIHYSLTLFLLFQLFLPAALAQEPQESDKAAKLLASLSVEEKVGQLFIVPFSGNNTTPGSDIHTLITQYKVGGVVLQTANYNFTNHAKTPQEIALLSNRLQAHTLSNTSVPLFIAVDQEGDGWPYTRITGGVTPLPSPMSIGATWDAQNARDVGRIVGQELSAMGVNLLLGPVLDVLNDPRPAGRGDMGTRTFGGDPFWVGSLGSAYIQGVHEGSNNTVATVAKHFPGRGGSDRLPDNEIATVDKSLQALKRLELAPFFAVTNPDRPDSTDAMMSSHIRYRGFQGDIRQFTAPISFDAAGMSSLLNLPEFVPWREQGGLIVSDALGVPAVRKHYDPTLQTFPHRRIAREAFLAGNDLLILAQFDLDSIWSQQFANIKDAIEFFQSEYRNNSDFAAQVDESALRILRLKLKMFPNPTPNGLFVDGEVALAVSGQGTRTTNRIARQSLTLLSPGLDEYNQRLSRPPGVDEKLLFISDSRLVRECFEDTNACQPFEPLPTDALEEIVLRLYGPDTTAQALPENVNSINFAELKQVLVGSLAQAGDTGASDVAAAEEALISHSPEEVTAFIQQADWIIFAMQDVNTDRYAASDALKLFLAQGLSSLYNKNLIVFALNSPYYLDTTEISKLTAYFALYSKTTPYLETAVRALYGEAAPQGASPVSVDGVNYNLVHVLSPDPARNFEVMVKEISPPDAYPPVTVRAQAGPILDYNGHPVPDGTPVEFDVTYLSGQKATIPLTHTVSGTAEISFTLLEAGTVEITARSGEVASQHPQRVTVAAAPATPTLAPTIAPADTPTTFPTPTATVAPSATPTASPSPAPVVTPTPSPSLALPGNSEAALLPPKNVTPADFLASLGIIFLSFVAGLALWRPWRSQNRTRLALVSFIGGMTAYLLYGIGWLRPDLWFFPQASIVAQRATLFVLVFLFGAAGAVINEQLTISN